MFKIEQSKTKESPKGHYIKQSEHRMENEIHRLADKLKKHESLPLNQAHKPEKGASQKEAGIPSLRKY
jgi:hypothetical protein